MRVSIELTPRDLDSLVTELNLVREKLPSADMINVPDLLRMPVRSWEGCRAAKAFYKRVVPHLRAIDFDPSAPLPIAEYLAAHGIDEVLVVAGDPPQDMGRKVYPTNSVEMIAKFKRELPGVRVYAALDPYRHSLRDEREAIRRKVGAGADGFFTQPMFDLRLMDIYAELTDPATTFWGASPVLTDRSRNYWETTNRVVFPKAFKPTMEWNRAFAAGLMDRVREMGANVYFMPIQANVVEYLGGIV